eukprot:3035968-Prymnesium_polylepis.1
MPAGDLRHPFDNVLHRRENHIVAGMRGEDEALAVIRVEGVSESLFQLAQVGTEVPMEKVEPVW